MRQDAQEDRRSTGRRSPRRSAAPPRATTPTLGRAGARGAEPAAQADRAAPRRSVCGTAKKTLTRLADPQQRRAVGVDAFEVPGARRRDVGGAGVERALARLQHRARAGRPGRARSSSMRSIVDGKQLKSVPTCCASQQAATWPIASSSTGFRTSRGVSPTAKKSVQADVEQLGVDAARRSSRRCGARSGTPGRGTCRSCRARGRSSAKARAAPSGAAAGSASRLEAELGASPPGRAPLKIVAPIEAGVGVDDLGADLERQRLVVERDPVEGANVLDHLQRLRCRPAGRRPRP